MSFVADLKWRQHTDWQFFDVAVQKNREIWIENQQANEWSLSISSAPLNKTVPKGKKI